MKRTLAQHGVAFRFNGIPWFDDDEIGGFVSEPRWKEADLTGAQLREVEELVAEHRAARPQDKPDWVRWAVMEHNGVDHTHRPGKPLISRRPAYGYTCRYCDGAVVNPDPGDFPFYGGPADGTYLVTDGRPTWRVPVVEPVSVMVPTDELNATMGVAMYRRRGDAYYIDD